MIEKIPGGIHPPFRIVAMCEHQGRVFVATEQRVYELINGLWHPMIFVDGTHGIAVATDAEIEASGQIGKDNG